MNLIDQLVNIFKGALTTVFEQEATDSKYMNQSILGCRWRAFWGIMEACRKSIIPITKVLALSIAKHREEEHGEDKSRTISSLTRSMTDEQIKASEAKAGYWSAG